MKMAVANKTGTLTSALLVWWSKLEQAPRLTASDIEENPSVGGSRG
jgi:hypothetical protein